MVLLLPALALGETMDDLVNRDGLYYKNFTDVPFTGKIVDYHPNGQLRSKGTSKDGKLDGPWVSYYDNGQLNRKGNYKDGKKDGLWVFYGENGQLLSKLTVGQDGKIIVED
jgi:antitoxin component YwqK of YwqJK toxin-antitoxin module